MSWKKKERELTKEEAIKQAKKDLEPYWHHSTPLLSAIRNGNTVNLLPLHDSILTGLWVLICVSWENIAHHGLIQRAQTWTRLYGAYDTKFIFFIHSKYLILQDIKRTPYLISAFDPTHIVVMDHRGDYRDAINPEDQDISCSFLKKGEVMSSQFYKQLDHECLTQIERSIQNHLRLEDPGLPLAPPIDEPIELRQTLISIPLKAKTLGKAEGVEIKGKWKNENNQVAAIDPDAVMTLQTRGKSLWIAASAAKRDPIEIRININGIPILEYQVGRDLQLTDRGDAVCTIEKPGLYHLLDQLTETDTPIILSIRPNEANFAIFYGVIFSD